MSNLKQYGNLLKVDSVQLSTYEIDESIFLNRNAYPVNEFYDSSSVMGGLIEDKTIEVNGISATNGCDKELEREIERERGNHFQMQNRNEKEKEKGKEKEKKNENERERETETDTDTDTRNFQIKNYNIYKEMYEESVKNPERFWGDLGKSSLRWFQLFTKVYTGDFKKGNVSWFINGKINACDNCVDRWVEKHPDKVAIIWEKDSPGESKKITYKKLLENTCRVANLLKYYGVKKQDTVTIYLPMIPELVYSLLACARLGAVHNVVFAGYSAGSLCERILDSKSRVLITSDFGLRGGKITKLKQIADKAMEMCKIIKTCIVFKNKTKITPPPDDANATLNVMKNGDSMNNTSESIGININGKGYNSDMKSSFSSSNVSFLNTTMNINPVMNNSENTDLRNYQESSVQNEVNGIVNHITRRTAEDGIDGTKEGYQILESEQNKQSMDADHYGNMHNKSKNENKIASPEMTDSLELGSVPYVTSFNASVYKNATNYNSNSNSSSETDVQYEKSVNFDERICKLKKGRDVDGTALMKNMRPYCPIEYVDSEDFLCLLYTSGSTGKPKGVAHTTAGYLLYAYATCKFIFDVRENDIFGCVADIGWVTGHTYVLYGPLLNGITTLIFSSIPTYPNCGRYWKLIETHRITQFYTAPTALRALMKYGDHWLDNYDLSSCRILGTVGEPINPETWRWYYNVVGKRRCTIVDTYWQTETGGIVIAPIPGLCKLKPGCATLPFFGVELEILDSKTLKPLKGPNVCGLLCIKNPWPGMLRTVYGNHNRLIKTYFEACPNYYFTGDGAYRDFDGYYWISGRIDDTLNVSGHRLGAAEIEHSLVQHIAIAEAAVVSFPHAVKGEGILCFVVKKKAYCKSLNDGDKPVEAGCCNSSRDCMETVHSLQHNGGKENGKNRQMETKTETQINTEKETKKEKDKDKDNEKENGNGKIKYISDAELIKELKLCVRQFIGPIATPDLICIVPDLPKTRSGKIIRRILRTIANGLMDFGDITTVANSEVIDIIKERFIECRHSS